jgi:hypothetical protein
MTIEVFKTNVTERKDANMLIKAITNIECDYIPNFDLDDCDNILRIKNRSGAVMSAFVIEILKDYGFIAEVLPDTISIENNFDRLVRLTYN